MRVLTTIPKAADVKKNCILTIGNFDGVHIGHQEILTAGAQIAMQNKTELVAITFEPHPVVVLHPTRTIGVLTPVELKKHLLVKFGVDCLFALPTTSELLALSPWDFAERFIVNTIDPALVIEGENFHFGKGRVGNIHTLAAIGQEKGFDVRVVPSKQAKLTIGQNVKVSSTLIRNMLESSKVDDAAIALGRPYRLMGRIVPGHGKGKQLGFPTANLDPLRQIIPADGVYAGRIEIADSLAALCREQSKLPAVFSVGQARTFGLQHPLLIEAHALDQTLENLYGKYMAMDFIKKIRDQVKFQTEPQLAQQIQKDCQNAKQILTA